MIIAIDFDGTCVTHEFPNVGKDIGAASVLKELVANGHQLILWTMRSDDSVVNAPHRSDIHNQAGNYLSDAIKWFEVNEIPLYGVQKNPEQDSWTSSPKAYAQLYIDDAALGCPLIYPLHYDTYSLPRISDRPFADWIKIRSYLISNKIIKSEI